jgi:nucleoid-associated protein YgaU
MVNSQKSSPTGFGIAGPETALFTGRVQGHKFSLKILAEVLNELEKKSTVKAKQLASHMDYDKLTELAKQGVKEKDPKNNPDVVPSKYLFLWGMGTNDDSLKEVKDAVQKFQDMLAIAGYLDCRYECKIKSKSKATAVKLFEGGIVGIYNSERDAKAEAKAGEVAHAKEKGTWKGWIRFESSAKAVKLDKGSIVGSFSSRYMAEKESEDGKYWVKGLETGDKYGGFGDKTLDAYVRWLTNYNKNKLSETETPKTSYTVKKGDTLSGIANRFGMDGWYDIYELNKNSVKNPDLIKVGQVLSLPLLDRNKEGKDLLSKKATDSDNYYGGRSYVCPFEKFSVTLCDFDGEPAKIDSKTPYIVMTEDGEVLVKGKISSSDEIRIDLPKGLNLVLLVNNLEYAIM